MLSGDGHVILAPHSRTEVEINAGELNTGFLSLRMQMGAGSTVKVLTSEGYVPVSYTHLQRRHVLYKAECVPQTPAA